MNPSTHPGTRATGEVPPRITAKSRPKTGRRLGTPVILAMVLVLVLLVARSGGGAGSAEALRLPESVAGTWISEDPRYEGRSIQIDPALVVIRPGAEEQAAVGIVKDVRGWQEGGQDVIRVVYQTDEGDLSIDLMPQVGGGLRLRHPNEVLWVRR